MRWYLGIKHHQVVAHTELILLLWQVGICETPADRQLEFDPSDCGISEVTGTGCQSGIFENPEDTLPLWISWKSPLVRQDEHSTHA